MSPMQIEGLLQRGSTLQPQLLNGPGHARADRSSKQLTPDIYHALYLLEMHHLALSGKQGYGSRNHSLINEAADRAVDPLQTIHRDTNFLPSGRCHRHPPIWTTPTLSLSGFAFDTSSLPRALHRPAALSEGDLARYRRVPPLYSWLLPMTRNPPPVQSCDCPRPAGAGRTGPYDAVTAQ